MTEPVGGADDPKELSPTAEPPDPRALLAKAARRHRKRVARTRRAVEEDRKRADDSPSLRERASLILARADPRARGPATLTLIGFDEQTTHRIELQHGDTAKAWADRAFRDARRYEQGARLAQPRLTELDGRLRELDALIEELDTEEDPADRKPIRALFRRAEDLGVRVSGVPRSTKSASASAKGPSARSPFWRFTGAGGRPILVGRSAADNDVLTQRIAKPRDLWLHARGVTGSHVVVPMTQGETWPPQLMLDAAHLALHYSDARDRPAGEVSAVAKRYLRKPKRAAPGAMLVSREKVLWVDVEPQRLKRLLATKDSAPVAAQGAHERTARRG